MPCMLIGFSGRLRSGKDAAASPLIAAGWHHGSFARAIKDFMYALNPIVPFPDGGYARLSFLVDARGWERAKDEYPEVRKLLQRCGADAGRTVLGDDVWVDAALHEVPAGGHAVFTDCRFPNEATAIQDRGGLVIRIDRPSLGDPGPDAHTSETALDDFPFDARIVNDSSLTDLHARVAAILASARQ